MLYILMVLGVISSGVISGLFLWQGRWYDILIFLALAVGFFVVWTCIHFVFWFIVSRFIKLDGPEKRPNKLISWVVLETEKIVLFYGRAHIHKEGFEMIPTDRRFLLVGNHRSNFDPILCTVAMPEKGLAYVSKPSNFHIPMAGRLIHKCCYLPLDRDNVKNAIVTINQAVKYMKDDIASIGIFPEGTRNRQKDGLLEFRNGAFKIATKAKAPIVIITIKNAEKIMKNCLWKRTHIYMKVVAVIGAEEVASMNTAEISDKVREIMLQNL